MAGERTGAAQRLRCVLEFMSPDGVDAEGEVKNQVLAGLKFVAS
jgi:hypothetical protein